MNASNLTTSVCSSSNLQVNKRVRSSGLRVARVGLFGFVLWVVRSSEWPIHKCYQMLLVSPRPLGPRLMRLNEAAPSPCIFFQQLGLLKEVTRS